jgi:hypothetical protein
MKKMKPFKYYDVKENTELTYWWGSLNESSINSFHHEKN